MADRETPPLGTVQILLATRDGAKYLPELLESLKGQSFPNWSLVVSDDGSADSTLDIVQAFAAKQPQEVMILPTKPTGSAKGNFFRLLQDSPGAPYFALCDQDDVWLPSKLERLMAACRSQEGAKTGGTPIAVYSDLRVVDASLGTRAESFMREMRTDPDRVSFGSLLVENSIPGCSMLFNRALLTEFRAAEASTDAALMHDWWLCLLAEARGQLAYVREPLVLYRQHGQNAAGAVHRSGARFVWKKLVEGGKGERAATLRQAQAFLSAHGHSLSGKQAGTLYAYAEFDRLGKAARVWRCLRLGLLKQTFSRRLYQLMWI